MKKVILFFIFICFFSCYSKSMTVNVIKLEDKSIIGNLTFRENSEGLLLDINIKGLSSGLHGMHIHTNPSIDPAEKDGTMVLGLAAGGHYDTNEKHIHLGPYDKKGSISDLPALYVDEYGNSNYTILLSKIKSLDEINNRSIIIHAKGDNYSDNPVSLGGGGPRVAGAILQVI